jgi:hypothetical protein
LPPDFQSSYIFEIYIELTHSVLQKHQWTTVAEGILFEHHSPSIERHQIIMGKFLKDKDGQMVAIDGAPVLERSLDKKEKACEGCGFEKWVLGDKCFIVHKTDGGMQRLCPNCALAQGLPKEHYKKNYYATALLGAAEQAEGFTIALLNPLDLVACFCHF